MFKTATIGAGLVAGTLVTAVLPGFAGASDHDNSLLTQPFLQMPGHREVSVVWFTEQAGEAHYVITGSRAELERLGDTMPTDRPGRSIELHAADSFRMSRTAEDASSAIADKPAASDGIVERPVYRHEARVTGVHPQHGSDYRVVSLVDGEAVYSPIYHLDDELGRNEGATILLTSDHQQKNNTPANLQWASTLLGDIDAVFFAGDLVNVPDRASEWFDATNEKAFFPGLQGTAQYSASNGNVYTGGAILQNAPIYPAIGNHEVQGRIDGMTSLNASFNSPVPRGVAEEVYETVAADVNPTGDPAVREQWIEDNSWSTTTYEEIFTLPADGPAGEQYYATNVGNVRLITLFSTRIWRSPSVQVDPSTRTGTTRYQEAAANLDDPLAQGHGSFPFVSLAVDSAQYDWLRDELSSRETALADYVVVMMHEGPQGLGDNVMPHFGEPQEVEEYDEAGNLIGIRYDYPADGNMLLTDVSPLLENSGVVDLVHNGHSHLWNRFESANGVNYIETSNVGNSYGAYHELSGRSRPVPPAPWNADDYLAQGNPGGLEAVVPTVAPDTNDAGVSLPFVFSNDRTAFTAIDSETGEVTSWVLDTTDPDAEPYVFDVFTLD